MSALCTNNAVMMPETDNAVMMPEESLQNDVQRIANLKAKNYVAMWQGWAAVNRQCCGDT